MERKTSFSKRLIFDVKVALRRTCVKHDLLDDFLAFQSGKYELKVQGRNGKEDTSRVRSDPGVMN